jgi:HAD superfamily hydrolase (TIGR01509 family)
VKKILLLFLLLPFSWMQAAYYEHPDIIVFDFGGVVAHTDGDVYAKKQQSQLEHLGIKHRVAKSLVAKARKKRNEVAFWQTYQMKSGLEFPLNWMDLWDMMRRESMRIDPKIDKIIHELKKQGCKVAMLSNVSSARAADFRRLGLYKSFYPTVLSCDINVEKPHKKAYKILLKKLGNVSPGRCFFIDDKMENVKAAIKLGIQSVQFKSPEDLRWELAIRNILPPK